MTTTTPGSVAQTTTGVAAALAILYFFRPVLVPLFLAVLLRILISGIVSLVVRIVPRAPRWLVLVVTAATVGFSAYSIFIVILQGVGDLVSQSASLPHKLDHLIQRSTIGFGRKFDLPTVLNIINFPEMEKSVTSGMGDAVSKAFLTLLFFVFMLWGSSTNKDPKLVRVTSNEARAQTQRLVLNRITRSVQAYLLSQTAINLGIALICAGVFRMAELPNTAFWSVVVLLLAFVPVVGPFLASIVPALFAAVHGQSMSLAIIVFLVIQSIFQIAHNLIQPRVQAKSNNIDPLVGVFALGIWTLLWGVPGAILATPLTVLMMVVAAQFESSRWLAVFISHDGVPDPVDSETT